MWTLGSGHCSLLVVQSVIGLMNEARRRINFVTVANSDDSHCISSHAAAPASGDSHQATAVLFSASYPIFYAPQLYRQVLLGRVLAMGILAVCLSVRPSVCHDPVVYQAQVRQRLRVFTI